MWFERFARVEWLGALGHDDRLIAGGIIRTNRVCF
jgi:hypothetical protein